MNRKYDQAPHHANDIELNINDNALIEYNVFDTFPGCYGEYDSFFVSRCHVCRYRLPCARLTLRSE